MKKTINFKAFEKNMAQSGSSQFRGFIDFIRSQGVVGLAVGLVLGGATATVVKSLIDNVIMPPIGLLLGSTDGLKGLALSLGESAKGEPVLWHYGIFINDFIYFLIIALVIYLVVKVLKADRLDKKKE